MEGEGKGLSITWAGGRTLDGEGHRAGRGDRNREDLLGYDNLIYSPVSYHCHLLFSLPSRDVNGNSERQSNLPKITQHRRGRYWTLHLVFF